MCTLIVPPPIAKNNRWLKQTVLTLASDPNPRMICNRSRLLNAHEEPHSACSCVNIAEVSSSYHSIPSQNSEVITSAEFHPTHCNTLHIALKGSIRLVDLR
ncbi:uncharacterized protein LOC123886794 [Trifolium pratense]|uniref:uncharacterized protein LOC123886794 n=1 Tax=Trifolium pratense TaxID=57577 RepID=UPI001E694B61|nr:uncharacterized protein LOC123886794 [Trifolium pratense]